MHILLMHTPHRPSVEHIERLIAATPNMQVTVAGSEQEAVDAVRDVEVIFGQRYLRQCLPYATNLRWVQATTTGTDRLPCAELVDKNIILTRFTLSAPVIARHAVTLAWAIVRGLPQSWDNQLRKRWDKGITFLPFPKRAAVFGTGSIGCEIARLLKADGLQVVGIKRQLNSHDLPDFDEIYDRTAWRPVLPRIDWCFLALPHTIETKNLMDEAALRLLPKHAIVVNVGRGETLGTEGLIRVLKEGHLGGAALDVLPAEYEPLSHKAPIWEIPRLIITPHVAAYDPDRGSLVERFCEEQLRRYLSGRELLEVILPYH